MSRRHVVDSVAFALCAYDESHEPSYNNDDIAHAITAQLLADGHVARCEPCIGTGFISWEEANRSGGIDIKGMDCAACSGTGVAPQSEAPALDDRSAP